MMWFKNEWTDLTNGPLNRYYYNNATLDIGNYMLYSIVEKERYHYLLTCIKLSYVGSISFSLSIEIQKFQIYPRIWLLNKSINILTKYRKTIPKENIYYNGNENIQEKFQALNVIHVYSVKTCHMQTRYCRVRL